MHPPETSPIVLDTNVLVAGASRRKESRAYRLLYNGILAARVPLVLTPSIALEYQDILQRPAILELAGLTHAEAVDLVNTLIGLSLKTQLRFVWRPNLQDESDNKFVDAAICASAILVTYNLTHYLRPDLRPHGWTAMTPDEFMTRYLLAEDS